MHQNINKTNNQYHFLCHFFVIIKIKQSQLLAIQSRLCGFKTAIWLDSVLGVFVYCVVNITNEHACCLHLCLCRFILAVVTIKAAGPASEAAVCSHVAGGPAKRGPWLRNTWSVCDTGDGNGSRSAWSKATRQTASTAESQSESKLFVMVKRSQWIQWGLCRARQGTMEQPSLSVTFRSFWSCAGKRKQQTFYVCSLIWNECAHKDTQE